VIAPAGRDLADPPGSGGPGGVLDLARVAHRFGSRWVLRDCTLRLDPGEAVALIGGNGTGKTTLLRIVATLLRPTRGAARVFGVDVVGDAAAVRERVAMMGFSAALYEDLTAVENLAFAMRMQGRRPEPAEIARVLEAVGLAPHGDARVRGFSSGMRRRVALARVLLRPPELLLLDEPYAALDDEGVGLINGVIRQIVARGGAVLAATHDLPRAAGVMERVVRLDAGILSDVPAARAYAVAGEGWGSPEGAGGVPWR
jgi:heme exporter protein A